MGQVFSTVLRVITWPGKDLPDQASCPPLGSGNPPPEVIWLHNGNEIQESEDFHFERRGSQHSLCIQEVFPEDTGTYTCEAWNGAGAVRTQAVLTVQGEAELPGRQVLLLWPWGACFGPIPAPQAVPRQIPPALSEWSAEVPVLS